MVAVTERRLGCEKRTHAERGFVRRGSCGVEGGGEIGRGNWGCG